VRRKENDLIVALRANDPTIGYNKRPTLNGPYISKWRRKQLGFFSGSSVAEPADPD